MNEYVMGTLHNILIMITIMLLFININMLLLLLLLLPKIFEKVTKKQHQIGLKPKNVQIIHNYWYA